MVSDDFSFPTITEPFPLFVGSPSLWNVSYEVFSRERDDDQQFQRRKSFPMADRDMKIVGNHGIGCKEDDEERMDMLWENFNDELRPIPSLDKNKEQRRLRKGGGGGGGRFDSGVTGDKAELYCVKTWKMSKTSSALRYYSFSCVFLSPNHFMGVIDFSSASSLCMIETHHKRHAILSPRPIFSFEGNRKLVVRSMTSTIPADHVSHDQERLTGDSFIRGHLKNLSPYQPILPFEVLSNHLGRRPEEIIKLDANENPYGPPPEVVEALGALKFPYVYPDPESRRLRAALAEDSGLESDYILAGCGADELIDLIMRCVLDPGDKIVDCPPTFTMYEFDAAVNGALVIKVPRKGDFSLNSDRIIEVVKSEKPKIIFLTSPNNPDGSIINDVDLMRILDLPILVVLDEAYIEFSGLESRMTWVKKHENLIVLRTFSKRAGLAGLRVGYGGFPLSIIEYLWRAKQPYNVSVAAEVSACVALQNPIYLETVKEALVQERERLYKLLCEVPYLKPYPSYSNFILCEVTSGKDAKKLKDDLAQSGVMIRHYNKKELRGYVRVSVGKPEHTDALMECLKVLT
ncbi:hypothetical protein NE237_023172 [Protea cynaroides]|uniref:histidinol-phosphate transaminase n=1 Tax=Protea cynaroides TaxID=273540 RepID=A0A9Q0HEF1_9MAGN|nr:hypothetical protein NE237_023172 [Protea cynaroides]